MDVAPVIDSDACSHEAVLVPPRNRRGQPLTDVGTNPDPFIGQALSGKYRVLARLGTGGFGAVYSAQNLSLGTEVAIKVARNAGDDARPMREAQIAAGLQSPYSVRVYDVGRLDDGALYIVMERLHGRSLRQFLEQEGPLPVPLAASWLAQVCWALHEAHALGLVHRDIKPSNLFVVEGPSMQAHLRLLDFGLAKQVEAPEGDVTDSGKLLGSPPYMSPEQVRAAGVGAQSDLWALGVVLYECLSGRLPFERPTPGATLVAIAAEPPVPLASVVADLPKAVLTLVDRCLRKAPHERFGSAQELGAALAALGGQDMASSIPPRREARASASDVAASSTTVATMAVAGSGPPRAYRKAAPWALGAALLGGNALWLSTRGAPSPSRETAPVQRVASAPKAEAKPEAPSKEAPRDVSAAPAASATAVAAPPPAPPRTARTPARAQPEPSPKATASAPSPRPRLVLDPDF